MTRKPQTVAIAPGLMPAFPVSSTVEEESGYYNLRSNSNWFYRKLWNFLVKRNVLEPYMVSHTTWTFHPESAEDLNDSICASMHRYLDDGYEPKDLVVIVGPQTFYELTGSPVFRKLVTFQSVDIRRGRGSRHEIFDMPIYVIPHLTGLACVPRVVITTDGKDYTFNRQSFAGIAQ